MNIGYAPLFGVAVPRFVSHRWCFGFEGDEVDELFDGAQERWLQVSVGVDAGKDVLPALGDVFLGVVGATESAQDAFFPFFGSGDFWPGFDTEDAGFDCLPDIDKGVTDDDDVAGGSGCFEGFGDDAAFFGAVDEVVDEDAEFAAGGWTKGGDCSGEIVNAVEGFDDDTFYAEVMTPDLFDKLCVVDTFYPDAAGASGAGWCIFKSYGPGARYLGAGLGGWTSGGYQVDGFTFEEEAGAQGEGFDASMAVFEAYDAHAADGFEGDGDSYPAAGDVFEEHAGFNGDFAKFGGLGGCKVC